MGKKVLIVDDSSTMRKIVTRSLRQAGLDFDQILEAGDGVEALKALEAEKVDIILCDINMPNMDGLQLLAQIKANPQWQAVQVVMITTEGNQARVMEAVGLGAAGYVRKPFTADQIKEKLLSLS